MPHSPNHIHFIWLGSVLRETAAHPHQSRLREWKLNNPRHTIHLWFSRSALLSKPEAYQALHHFCVDTGIIPGDIDSLPMKKHVRDFIVRCMQHDSPNWGALSDLLRFYVLKAGGFYFDTDIITSEETSELYDLDLPFGFALHLRAPTMTSFALSGLNDSDFEVLKTCGISDELLNGATIDNYTETEFEGQDSYELYCALPNDLPLKNKIIPPERFYYSPDMIAAVSSSEFITKCVELVESMISSPQIEEIYQQLHHSDPEKRRLATCYTTGEIAFAVCLQLKNRESRPFISFDLIASKEERVKISNAEDFDNISIHHICEHAGLQSLDERSYMVQEETRSSIDYSSYEDEILNLFYRSIKNRSTLFLSGLFTFWSKKIDEETSISQSFVLK